MISLVIPCFNENEVLELTYRTLVTEAENWAEPIEMVLVDDGSHDNTWAIIESLAHRDTRVRGVRLSRNFGHQAAVGAGLEAARGDAVVVLDADLQDPPAVIGQLIDCWRDGFEVVAALRTRRQGERRLKKVLGYLFYRVLARLTNVPVPIDTGDFALLDRRVVEVMLGCPEQAMFWRGLRCFAGFRHTFVKFERPARAAGQSKYTLGKLAQLACTGLVSFSDVPPRLGLYLGLLGMFLTMLLGLGSLGFALATGETMPLSWLGLSLYFLGSVQLLCVGVLGEYLNRIYTEVRQRPRWIIASRAGFERSDPRPRRKKRITKG